MYILTNWHISTDSNVQKYKNKIFIDYSFSRNKTTETNQQ